jgi:hypothetical protein
MSAIRWWSLTGSVLAGLVLSGCPLTFEDLPASIVPSNRTLGSLYVDIRQQSTVDRGIGPQADALYATADGRIVSPREESGMDTAFVNGRVGEPPRTCARSARFRIWRSLFLAPLVITNSTIRFEHDFVTTSLINCVQEIASAMEQSPASAGAPYNGEAGAASSPLPTPLPEPTLPTRP